MADDQEKMLALRLLSATARHDVTAIRNILPQTSANVQDSTTGFTPLHTAVRSSTDPEQESSADEELIAATVSLLLDDGAIWNDLDQKDETPGCVAHRLGFTKVYDQIVAAGVRAELLLNRLDELEPDDGQESFKEEAKVDVEPPEDYIDRWDSNADFLRSSLKFTNSQLLDSSSNAVMMDWESEIMSRHADRLLPTEGLRAMNIGHGMGIVDTAIQTHAPLEHHIVEAHPAVLAQMRKTGWFEKPGVHIHQGRWQDVLPELIIKGVTLDAIYYDTFAEEYKDLKELFSEHVIGLLDQTGRFSFYNGLGADRRVSYDVYTSVVAIDLREAGYKTEWEELAVPRVDWQGVRRSYWNIDFYRLPTCSFA